MFKKNINKNLIKKGFLIIISSPSGVGKTTIARKLLKIFKNSYLSVSCTTRQPRLNEKNGIDYFFSDKKKFLRIKKQNKFLESAKVYKNFYGTLKSEVFKNLSKNKIVFLDVDWQGAREIRKKMNGDCFSIYLLPPSIKILKQRLIKRHLNNLKLAYERFSLSKKDIPYYQEYDCTIVNNSLEKCIQEVKMEIKNYIKKKLLKKKIEDKVNKLLKS